MRTCYNFPVFAELVRGEVLDRDAVLRHYRAIRDRTRRIFDCLSPAAYYERPILLRHPFVFYEGHLPAFSVIAIVKNALSRRGVDEDLEVLFARGIDPESEAAARRKSIRAWPPRDEVLAYGRAADALIERTIENEQLWDDRNPHLRNAEALFTALEHELMHQETLLYMIHELPRELRSMPPGGFEPALRPVPTRAPPNEWIEIPAGTATLGMARGSHRFGWDNEFPQMRVGVPRFSIQKFDVTNGEYIRFVAAGGYDDPGFWSGEGWQWARSSGSQRPHFWTVREGEVCWRGMADDGPLPLDGPVYVTHHEAEAYARWIGARLPSEAEFHRAAYGTPSGEEREHPWGDAWPDETRGNFGFANWDPVPVGSYPAGASAWDVHDLVGNGWEWTSTCFAGFPGFEPMPSYPVYSTDFFDRQHYVMKGASPATARELIRRSFRNWFRPGYPYVYATFRCIR